MSDAPSFWIQVREPSRTHVVTVDRDTDVGRDCDDGILVDDAAVSRRHLRLEPTVDGLVVVDLHSANGTTVDGTRLTEARIVRPGNVIRLGETELAVFEGHHTDAAKAPGESAGLSERPSAGARRLNTKAAKSISKGAFRRPSGG